LEVATTSVSWELHEEAYPAPPHALASADVAQKLARRYRDYREGKEKLPSLAYYCLTAAEQEGLRPVSSEDDKRKAAARHFNLSSNLLDRLGDLAGTEGADGQARKYAPETSSAHSEADLKWLDAATRALIRQVAKVEAGENPPKITKEDLP